DRHGIGPHTTPTALPGPRGPGGPRDGRDGRTVVHGRSRQRSDGGGQPAGRQREPLMSEFFKALQRAEQERALRGQAIPELVELPPAAPTEISKELSKEFSKELPAPRPFDLHTEGI